jgi:glucose-1-phosphate thymidylyltransferase
MKKGIILAGGKASRLHPATLAFGKPFLPVFDKPMIFHPLTVLMRAGIRDVLIVIAPRDRALFQALLGDGSQIGLRISYVEQPVARGIADAFVLGEEFIGDDSVCLILCDNFFHGPGIDSIVHRAWGVNRGATVFCIHVGDPSAYGVARFDDAGRVRELVEKPESPISNWAVTGLYIYDSRAPRLAKTLKPSKRGELEITDLNIKYLEDGALDAVRFDRGYAWSDLGTYASILDTGRLIASAEQREGARIGCPYITAYNMGYIDARQLVKIADSLGNAGYAATLRKAAG